LFEFESAPQQARGRIYADPRWPGIAVDQAMGSLHEDVRYVK
jgi:hypothetical protein